MTGLKKYDIDLAALDPNGIAETQSPIAGASVTLNGALAWGATVINSGAGATAYLVWCNGSAWTVLGI